MSKDSPTISVQYGSRIVQIQKPCYYANNLLNDCYIEGAKAVLKAQEANRAAIRETELLAVPLPQEWPNEGETEREDEP